MVRRALVQNEERLQKKTLAAPMRPTSWTSFIYAVAASFPAVLVVPAVSRSRGPRAHSIATEPCTLQVLQGEPPNLKTDMTSSVAVTRATPFAVVRWTQCSVECHVKTFRNPNHVVILTRRRRGQSRRCQPRQRRRATLKHHWI